MQGENSRSWNVALSLSFVGCFSHLIPSPVLACPELSLFSSNWLKIGVLSMPFCHLGMVPCYVMSKKVVCGL